MSRDWGSVENARQGKMVDRSRELRVGALVSYIGIGLSILSGLLYTPWMIRTIGQADYGLYVIAGSLIAFVAVDFGLGGAVTKFLSEYRAAGDTAAEQRFLGIAFRLFGLMSVVLLIVMIALSFFIDSIYAELTVGEIERLKVVYAISGLLVVISFPFKPLDGILVAHERFISSRMFELVAKMATVILTVVALVLGWGLYAVVGVAAVVQLLKIAAQFVYARINIGMHVDLMARDQSAHASLFKFGAWTTISSVASRFTFLLAPSILGALSGSSEIAVFGVASTIEGYAYLFATALQGLFLPRVSRIVRNPDGGRREIEDLLIRVGRLQALVLGLVVCGFSVVGDEFFDLWIGAGYEQAYLVSLLLLVPGMVYFTQQIAQTTLAALNKVKYEAYGRMLVAATSVVASMILVPRYGAVGSGLGICIGNLIGSVFFMNLVYAKVLHIDVLRFFRECHLRLAPPFLLALLGGLAVGQALPGKSWFGLAGEALVIGMLYVGLVWVLYLRPSEKRLLVGSLSRRDNAG